VCVCVQVTVYRSSHLGGSKFAATVCVAMGDNLDWCVCGGDMYACACMFARVRGTTESSIFVRTLMHTYKHKHTHTSS